MADRFQPVHLSALYGAKSERRSRRRETGGLIVAALAFAALPARVGVAEFGDVILGLSVPRLPALRPQPARRPCRRGSPRPVHPRSAQGGGRVGRT